MKGTELLPIGGGGWYGWRGFTVAISPSAQMFSWETCLSPFPLLKGNVTVHGLTDSSGGVSNMHTPSIMNEPISYVDQAGSWDRLALVMELKSNSSVCKTVGKSKSLCAALSFGNGAGKAAACSLERVCVERACLGSLRVCIFSCRHV